MNVRFTHSGYNWIAFFCMIIVSWFGLLAMSVSDPSGISFFNNMGALDPFFQSEFWKAICVVSPEGQPLINLFLMWALMSVAMMAPTAFPLIHNYFSITLNKRGHVSVFSLPMLLGGYISVWIIYSLFAAGLQKTLTVQGLLVDHGLSVSNWLTALLLLIAGGYQFSSFKDACLTKCRSPLTFFMSNWKDGLTGSFKMGFLHGMTCVGCCWALMLLGFVGGTMNLVWMAIAMILMILEKMPEIGRFVTRPLGYALLGASAFVVMRSFIF